ncbi:MAG: hypothetical protein WKF92_09285 [Pyrinomonadaceae bacterium]
MPVLNFDPDGERIFYMESPPVPAGSPTAPANIVTFLSSVKVTGDDYRRHIEAKFASEMVPSPDLKWVAFKELHKIYIAPFAQTGKTLKLSATEAIVPIRNISAQSGDWLTWSPDSKTVAWTLGENFHELALENVFRQQQEKDTQAARSPGGQPPEAKVSPPAPVKTRIGFEFETWRPHGLVALTNARIITMRGGGGRRGDRTRHRPRRVQRIKAVGARVDVPREARRIDMKGRTIMPGIVDVHAHMGSNSLDISPEKQWPYYANLAYGVPTTHDPSASTQLVFSQSEMVKAGVMAGPRIFSTGFILYGAENAEKAVVNSLEDAAGHVDRMKAVGAFSLKSYNQPRRNQRQQIIKAARDRQMMVVPEGGSTYYYNISHILDGHTGIEHAVPIAPLYKDALTLFARSGVGYTPTLIVGLRRDLGGKLLVPAFRRFQEREATALHAARFGGRSLAPPDDGAGGRFLPSGASQNRPRFCPRRRAGSTGRPRAAAGPRGSLGIVDVRPGGDETFGGDPPSDYRRSVLPRPRRRHRLDRGGQTRRPDDHGQKPPYRHPQLGNDPLRDGERGAIRNRQHERDLPPATHPRALLLGARIPRSAKAACGSVIRERGVSSE